MKANLFIKSTVWILTFLVGNLFMEGKAVNVTTNEDDDPYKEFVSPQWGLKCPEGYIRLTEFKAQAQSSTTAKMYYDQLMKCISKAKAKRQKMLGKAYRKKQARFVEVEAKAMKEAAKYFKRAGIEMLDLGAYRLPDGTIVIEDDKHTLTPQPVTYQAIAKSKAPIMERDKSPNYDAHNEQTWPIYTGVETVSTKYIDHKPEIYRGENCTYVVTYNLIGFDYHWFHPNSRSALVDTETGDRYMVRYMEHYALDTYHWIHGQQGQVMRRVAVYPPLPEHIKKIDLVPGEIPAAERLGNVAPHREYNNLEVKAEMPFSNTIY